MSKEVSEEKVIRKIFMVRGEKVMLDQDLAELYQVQTKVLNQAVKRNSKRFPEDFMFQFTPEEWQNLKSQIVTSNWGGRRSEPFAINEGGRLKLQTPTDYGAAWSEVIGVQKGRLHKINFDFEVVEPVGTESPFMDVHQRNLGGSWEQVSLKNLSTTSGIQSIEVEFTPTKDEIKVRLSTTGLPPNTMAEMYFDNIKITDGTTSPVNAGGIANKLAFKYRIHDAAIGRFLSRDPLSMEYPWNSPYAFSENDVIRAIDLEGLEKAIISVYNLAGNGDSKLELTTSDDNLGAGQWEGTKYFEQHNKIDEDGNVQKIYTDFNENTEKWESGTASLKMSSDGVKRNATQPEVNNKELISNFNKSYRGKNFKSAVSNYAALVTLPISGIGVLKAPSLLEKIGAGFSALNTSDDLTSNFNSNGGTLLQNSLGSQAGNITKSILSAGGLLGGGVNANSFTGTSPVDKIIGAGGDLKGVIDGANNASGN